MQTFVEPVDFADGKYQLGPLSIKQIIELERNCGFKAPDGRVYPKSIYQIHDELGAGLGLQDERAVYVGGGAAHASDIREGLRLLLIAGNRAIVAGEEIEVGPVKAAQLCDDYLYPHRPLIEGQYLVWAGLSAAIVGIDIKKKPDQSAQSEDMSPSAAAESLPTAAPSGSTGRKSRSASTAKRSKRTTTAAKAET